MTYGTKYNSYSTKYHHDVVGFAIIDSPAPILYTGLGSILISALSETKIYNFKYMHQYTNDSINFVRELLTSWL